MNHILNGNGNGIIRLSSQPKPELTQAQFSAPVSDNSETQVVFQTNDGIFLRGVPLRITRHSLVFELYSPVVTPQFSEAFNNFKINLPAEAGYSGRVVIRSVVDAGTRIICEATLDEHSWAVLDHGPGIIKKDKVQGEFRDLLQNWQKFYRVNKDYKEVIADLHSFMTDLRLLLRAWGVE